MESDTLYMMLVYYDEVVKATCHERWRWLVSPSAWSQILKELDRPFSVSGAMLFGVPVKITAEVEDIELEEYCEDCRKKARA